MLNLSKWENKTNSDNSEALVRIIAIGNPVL